MKTTNAKNYTILVVDDESDNIRVFVNILNGLNYNVITALSGEKALEIAINILPNLIITDWEMPGKSGIEFLNDLKQNKSTFEIPVIMATGKMITSEDLQIALEAGAIDYVRKPIDKVELLARVKSAILYIETVKQKFKLEKQIVEEREQLAIKELEENRRKLTEYTIKLVKDSEFYHELLKIIEDTNNVDKVKTILRKLKIHMYDFNFNEFELIFDKVNPGFFGKLSDKFSNLSKNEKKLCVFLMLNMSTKDISAITNQNSDALKKARYRLRKKMNLNSDESLSSFLQSL